MLLSIRSKINGKLLYTVHFPDFKCLFQSSDTFLLKACLLFSPCFLYKNIAVIITIRARKRLSFQITFKEIQYFIKWKWKTTSNDYCFTFRFEPNLALFLLSRTPLLFNNSESEVHNFMEFFETVVNFCRLFVEVTSTLL